MTEILNFLKSLFEDPLEIGQDSSINQSLTVNADAALVKKNQSYRQTNSPFNVSDSRTHDGAILSKLPTRRIVFTDWLDVNTKHHAGSNNSYPIPQNADLFKLMSKGLNHILYRIIHQS